MKQFAKNFITAWRRLALPTADQKIVVAVSGGADSVSLLAVLHELQTAKKLNLEIVAAHFNHKLRGAASDADAEFVKNLAAEMNFDCEIRNPKSEIRNRDNLEQAARQARYEFLLEIAENKSASAVLTAHTQNDQAETFLLRLIRGSSADGLGAMRSIRDFESKIQNSKSKIQLVRPLLSWARREDTENYCRETDLEFRHDAMNDDERFDRVRIRKNLIPLLATFNPQIIETLANTADLLREDAEELNKIAASILKVAQDADGNLQPSAFSLQPSTIRRRILRLWLGERRGDLRQINAKHLRAVEDLVTKNAGGRVVELPCGAVARRGGKLLFLSGVEKTSPDN